MSHRTILLVLLALAALTGSVALWVAFDIDRAALADAVRVWLEQARGTPWALPLVCALYLLAGAVLFPVMALNLLIAMVFGTVRGVVYGLVGAMLSATVFFYLGRLARRHHFSRLLEHPRIRRVDAALQRGGVTGIALLRMIPLAPYTVFNLACGISSLRFADFIAGTFLSALPGALARGLVGGSLMNLFLDPTLEDTILLVAGIGLWVAVVALSHLFLKKTHPPRH